MYNSNILNLCQDQLRSSPARYIKDYNHLKNRVNKSSARYNGKPVPFLYQPMLYSVQDRDLLREKVGRMNDILKKVIQKYRSDPEFRNYFAFPPVMEKLILLDPGYDKFFPVARFDVFYQDAQKLKFCELNADGTSGMNENRVLSKLFQDSRLMDMLKKKYTITPFNLFQSLLKMIINNYQTFCRKQSFPTHSRPRIAIADFTGDGVISEFHELKIFFSRQGYETVICDPREMNYTGNNLLYNGRKVDIVYRRATTARIVEEAGSLDDFFAACREKKVCLVGGFVSQIIHNKILFAILHNQKAVSFLSRRDHEFIARHIPKTKKLHTDDKNLINKLMTNKDKYILKPEDWFACHGVYAGRDYRPREWKKIIYKTRNKSYIMQEYVEVPELELPLIEGGKLKFAPFKYIIGIYMFNQSYSGLYTRVGRENIIGAAAESFTLPGYIYSPREG